MLDVCICTHNPQRSVLRQCLMAIATQNSPPQFRVLLVDNASNPPLNESLLDGLCRRGIPRLLIREERLGLTAARVAAFHQSTSEWVVFIDDDNVIAPDFLNVGHKFAGRHPEVGAFGGRVSLAPDIHVPGWMTPLLGSMGVKEEGDEILIGSTIEWGPHDPPGAGLWVRQILLERFVERTRTESAVFDLGRRGKGLGSCEDAVLVKGGRELGYSNAYVPALRVTHYLKPERFTFWHAMRSLTAYGRSIALYERVMALGGDHLGNSDKPGPVRAAFNAFYRERNRSMRFAATQAAYEWAYERSRRAFVQSGSMVDPKRQASMNLLPFLRTGARAQFDGRIIVVAEGTEEFAVFGPYWTLPAGCYELRAVIKPHRRTRDGEFVIGQVTAERGSRVLAEDKWLLDEDSSQNTTMEFRLAFSLSDELPPAARTIETRIFAPEDVSFSVARASLS